MWSITVCARIARNACFIVKTTLQNYVFTNQSSVNITLYANQGDIAEMCWFANAGETDDGSVNNALLRVEARMRCSKNEVIDLLDGCTFEALPGSSITVDNPVNYCNIQTGIKCTTPRIGTI